MQQIGELRFVERFLRGIDATLFESDLQLPKVLTKIEVLLSKEGLSLRRSCRERLADSPDLNSLLPLCLHLAVSCERRRDFIQRIFQLEAETQNCLMESLKSLQNSLQTKAEVGEILNRIEDLEEENDSLKEKLKKAIIANRQLSEKASDAQEERSRLSEECRRFRKEKSTVLEELFINDMKEYSELYRDLRNENRALLEQLEETETRNRELKDENLSMRSRIAEDSTAIIYLNDEIARLKRLAQELQEEVDWAVPREKENLDSSRESRPRRKRRVSVDTSHSLDSLRSERQELAENEHLRTYSQALVCKLDGLQRRLADATGQASLLRQENRRLERRNRHNEKKINALRLQQDIFVLETLP